MTKEEKAIKLLLDMQKILGKPELWSTKIKTELIKAMLNILNKGDN